jgi:hypothetical protein
MGKELGPGVGFEFPSFEVKWLKRDLLLFAASIGAAYPEELHFLYVSCDLDSYVLYDPMPNDVNRNSILNSLRSLHTLSSFLSSTPIKK